MRMLNLMLINKQGGVMAHAVIYQEAKSAMQSGKARTKKWHLTYKDDGQRFVEPVMGWVATNDTRPAQLHLTFASKEEAVAYAERNNIKYQLIETKTPSIKKKNYLANYHA